jgi:hypothetical protein
MRRIPLVVVLATTVFVAGCTAAPTSDASTGTLPADSPEPDTHTVDAGATDTPGPEPRVTTSACGELGTRAFPDRPGNLTRDSVLRFAKTHTEATTWNERLAGEPIRSASVSTTGVVVNETDTGYVVHVRYNFGTWWCNGAHGDSALHTRDYFLNESVVAVNDTTHYPRDGHAVVSARSILRTGTVLERYAGTPT